MTSGAGSGNKNLRTNCTLCRYFMIWECSEGRCEALVGRKSRRPLPPCPVCAAWDSSAARRTAPSAFPPYDPAAANLMLQPAPADVAPELGAVEVDLVDRFIRLL